MDTAPDGAAAFQLFQANPTAYNLVITDQGMPELDGIGLVWKLREVGFPGRIIVLSGGLSFANASTFADLRVDQVLSKPISGRALVKGIQGSSAFR